MASHPLWTPKNGGSTACNDQTRWQTFFAEIWDRAPDAALAHGGAAEEEEAAREFQTPSTPPWRVGIRRGSPGTCPRLYWGRPRLRHFSRAQGRHCYGGDSPWHKDAGAPPPRRGARVPGGAWWVNPG